MTNSPTVKPGQGKFILIVLAGFFISMCVPPETSTADTELQEQMRLDSLRKIRCPRLMSSAAEYYKNRDWKATVSVYKEIVDLGCDRDQEQEVYLYYAIAYEFLGKYDSSEYVLLKGLQKLPDNIDLKKRLAYSYQKQGKIDKQIIEYEKIIELNPEDTETMKNLSDLYSKKGMYREQINVLERLLKIDPNNETAIGDMAMAYEKSGLDAMAYYLERARNNPNNISYQIDVAQRLIEAGRAPEAVKVLKSALLIESNSKPILRLLGQAQYKAGNLPEASKAYEDFFNLDPRDHRIAIEISQVNLELGDYAKALRWADKAISIAPQSGEPFGQKANIYYKAFQTCRSTGITVDDRIVAALAYQYYLKAETAQYKRYTGSRKWLEDNRDDVLFRRQEWFMLTPQEQGQGFVKPKSDCYQWIDEKLMKSADW